MGEHLPCTQGVVGSNPIRSMVVSENPVTIYVITGFLFCDRLLLVVTLVVTNPTVSDGCWRLA